MPSGYITIKEASLRYNLSLTGVRKRLDILGVKYTWFQKSIIFQEDEFVKKKPKDLKLPDNYRITKHNN